MLPAYYRGDGSVVAALRRHDLASFEDAPVALRARGAKDQAQVARGDGEDDVADLAAAGDLH